MENRQTVNEPSGIRLLRLVNTQLPQILRKERKNENRICLYGTGTYWSAFEQSAYLLRQLFPDSSVTIWAHRDNPFPVVMASISDEELKKYAQQHIFGCDQPDYKEFTCRVTPSMPYHLWHRNEVQQFGEGLQEIFQQKDVC